MENKNVQALEDDALENVSGGRNLNEGLKSKSYVVTSTYGAIIYKDTNVTSGSNGTIPCGEVIFVNGSEITASDNSKWFKITAQKGYSAGYIMAIDVMPNTFSVNAFKV